MILNSLININIFSYLLRMILGSLHSVCRRQEQAMSSDLYINKEGENHEKWTVCPQFCFNERNRPGCPNLRVYGWISVSLVMCGLVNSFKTVTKVFGVTWA